MSLLKATMPALAISTLAISTLSLAACAQEEEEKTYEVGVEDVSGGELQVADPKPGEVEVNLPQTPMKNVPVQTEDAAEGEAGEAEAEEAPE